ncbi:ATP-binding protein [Paracoccus methylarcula]|uniref:Bacterial transcriptional activator domain-containing protein n=1 Tax=Paracoccus methylarcula TaxID=72022 RepID=A0A422QVC6_9RHOB|nr:AAA family ATPase [Paracoccus methylarcula]RNF33915.1 hypothetical protein A7A09_013425 [Paracoccus methylarcula]
MADNRSNQYLRLELLGQFRVIVAGRDLGEVAWPGRRSAELVQLLALADRHRLLRDQAIEALWPHLAAEAGAANLRKAAFHARQALDTEDAVVLSGGRVALFPAWQIETDVMEFEQAATAALRSRDPKQCETAAAAYSGILLPEALYEEWTLSRRDRLQSLYAELLRAAHCWERLVKVEPSDEEAYRELMRIALAAGNRHAAIRWYGQLRMNLQCELGLAPSPESQAVYDECIAGLGLPTAVFVGRQVELATAAVAMRAAGEGKIGALILRGPTGIGKSALCQQIAVAARDRGWRTITVAATGERRPYEPLAATVEQLLQADRGLLDVVNDRTRTTLAELTALVLPAKRRKDGLTRHMVIGAVNRLLAAARGKSTGVMLVIDDMHLADQATIDACMQLARAGGKFPLLIVLAYRAETAQQALVQGVASLGRAGRSTEIELGPLEHGEAVALAEAGAAGKPDARLLSEIAEMAEGNPFFVLELARGVAAGKLLPLNPSARDTIIARNLDLDDATAAMMRRLAVAGDHLEPAEVLALTGLSEEDGFALLDTAVETGVLTVTDARYRFRHHLVRQALVEQTPPHQRIAVHRDTARRLAASGAAPGLIARHWIDGGKPAEAIDWLLAAARLAIRLGAFSDGLVQLDKLLEQAPAHAEALRLRAEVLDALGDSRAPAAFVAAARVIGGTGAHDLRAKQALAQLKLGDPTGALRTVTGIEPETFEGRLAQALTWSGAAALGFADPGIGTAKAAESRRLAMEMGDSGALVVASWAQAAAAHARGDLRSSVRADLRDTSTLRDLAISIFDGQLCITQRLLYGARPYRDVISFAHSLRAEAERLGAARGQAFAVTLGGEAKLLAGRLDEADADLAVAARLNEDIGAATGLALALQRRAEVALYRECHADAAALLDDALAVARESDVGFHLFDRIYGTKIAAAIDPNLALFALEDAEASVRGPMETCPGCRITFAVPAAIAAARAGDLERASQYAHQVENLAAVVMRLPGWNAAAEEVKGHLCLANHDAGAATRFHTAADGFRRAGQPLDEARCATLAEASF